MYVWDRLTLLILVAFHLPVLFSSSYSHWTTISIIYASKSICVYLYCDILMTTSKFHFSMNCTCHFPSNCYVHLDFLQVFGEVPSSEMTEKFSDILQFCSHVSKLMVTEIRRRALNQSTGNKSQLVKKDLLAHLCKQKISVKNFSFIWVIPLMMTSVLYLDITQYQFFVRYRYMA